MNTKRIVFSHDEFPLDGEGRFLIVGQRVRARDAGRGSELEGTIVFVHRGSGVVLIEQDDAGEVFALNTIRARDAGACVEYVGYAAVIQGKEKILFPGDVVFCAGAARWFVCGDSQHEIIRVMVPATGEVLTVPIRAVTTKESQFVRVGSRWTIAGQEYILASVTADEWTLISLITGNRYHDPEPGLQRSETGVHGLPYHVFYGSVRKCGGPAPVERD